MDIGQTPRLQPEALTQPHGVVQGALGFVQLEVIVQVARIPQEPLYLGVGLPGVALAKRRAERDEHAEEDEGGDSVGHGISAL